MILLLTAASAVAGSVVLDLDGACPGPMTFDISGLTPGEQFVLLTGDGPGAAPIPGGPCAGENSGLDGRLSWYGPFRAAPDGSASLSPTIPAPACPLYVTAVDLTWCLHAEAQPFDGGGAFPHDNGLGLVWFNDVPTGIIDESQAMLHCYETYSPGECERRDGDCAGPGWCYNGDPSYEPCWGWESGCSGDAGRVWEYGTSFDTYGYWD